MKLQYEFALNLSRFAKHCVVLCCVVLCCVVLCLHVRLNSRLCAVWTHLQTAARGCVWRKAVLVHSNDHMCYDTTWRYCPRRSSTVGVHCFVCVCVTCQVFGLWVSFCVTLKQKTKNWKKKKKNYRHLKKNLKIFLLKTKKKTCESLWKFYCLQFCNFCDCFKRITKYIQFYVKVITTVLSFYFPLKFSCLVILSLKIVPRNN